MVATLCVDSPPLGYIGSLPDLSTSLPPPRSGLCSTAVGLSSFETLAIPPRLAGTRGAAAGQHTHDNGNEFIKQLFKHGNETGNLVSSLSLSLLLVVIAFASLALFALTCSCHCLPRSIAFSMMPCLFALPLLLVVVAVGCRSLFVVAGGSSLDGTQPCVVVVATSVVGGRCCRRGRGVGDRPRRGDWW